MAADKSEEVVARSEEIRAWNILLYFVVLDSVRLGVVIGTRGGLEVGAAVWVLLG